MSYSCGYCGNKVIDTYKEHVCNMKCLYCPNSLIFKETSVYRCENHDNIEFDWGYSVTKEKFGVTSIWFKYPPYYLYLDFDNNNLSLYRDCDKMLDILIIRLNYIPDINPDNSEYWFNRLLNMKAFI